MICKVALLCWTRLLRTSCASDQPGEGFTSTIQVWFWLPIKGESRNL